VVFEQEIRMTAEGTQRRTERIEGFSDAVFAIAITLPIVELKSPRVDPTGDLAAAYGGLSSDYLAYGLSVAVIGFYWAYSHFSGKIYLKTEHGFNLLTVLFLASVSITPFPARPFVEHVGDVNAHTAALVYAALLAAPSLAWTVRWLYAVKRGLLDPRLTPVYLHKLTVRYVATSGLMLLGVALTVAGAWQAGMILIALLTALYVLPPMGPQYKPGQEPIDDIEEADDAAIGEAQRRNGARP
jgi:uncharacterized membrane protein